MIKDLSYQNLKNLIKDKEENAAKVINTLADEYISLEEELKALKKRMLEIQERRKTLCYAAKVSAWSVNKDIPVIVICNNCIIKVTENNLEKDLNIIKTEN